MKPGTVLGGRFVTVSGPVGEGQSVDITAEPLDGTDLATLVAERGPLEHDAVIAVGSHVAAALAAAHHARAIHGHLTPERVVISGPVEGSPDSGSVQVGGFGAEAASGKSPYRAPEQVTGEGGDARSDLYGLGCLFMMMLTGEPPAAPAQARPSDGAQPAAQTGAPWPSDRRPDVDPALNGLVHDLLAESPARRPVSADEVTSRLGRIAADLRERQGPVALPITSPREPDESPGLTALGLAAAEASLGEELLEEEPQHEAARTQPIPVVAPGDGDGSRRRWGAGLASTPVPWTWLVGSAAAVLLVMVALLGTLLGGGEDPTAGAPATPTTTSSTPPPSQTSADPTTTDSAPSSTAPTTSATPTSAAPTPTSASPSATVASTSSPSARKPVTLAAAVKDLSATARRVVSSGAVKGSNGAELVRRADDLGRWVDRNEVQLRRRASDLGRFLDQLVKDGQITSAGYREVSAALAAVTSQL